MKRSFALTEAGAVGRRPRRAFEDFWRKTLMEGPSQEIFKNGGWLCLTDAQRYYTTLQFWQVTGSADGVYPGFWRTSRSILSATRGAGETPAIPGGYAIISDAPLSQGVFQIIGEICLTIGGFNQVDGYGLT